MLLMIRKIMTFTIFYCQIGCTGGVACDPNYQDLYYLYHYYCQIGFSSDIVDDPQDNNFYHIFYCQIGCTGGVVSDLDHIDDGRATLLFSLIHIFVLPHNNCIGIIIIIIGTKPIS